jgi:hypothetical protein
MNEAKRLDSTYASAVHPPCAQDDGPPDNGTILAMRPGSDWHWTASPRWTDSTPPCHRARPRSLSCGSGCSALMPSGPGSDVPECRSDARFNCPATKKNRSSIPNDWKPIYSQTRSGISAETVWHRRG